MTSSSEQQWDETPERDKSERDYGDEDIEVELSCGSLERSNPPSESIDEREDRELNIRIAGFEEGYAQGKAEAARKAREDERRRISDIIRDRNFASWQEEQILEYINGEYPECLRSTPSSQRSNRDDKE